MRFGQQDCLPIGDLCYYLGFSLVSCEGVVFVCVEVPNLQIKEKKNQSDEVWCSMFMLNHFFIEFTEQVAYCIVICNITVT